MQPYLDMRDADCGRYAIYFAPPVESALHRFGSAVLGRDAATGASVVRLPLDGLTPDRWEQVTAAPKVYGFHATLKPPFRLTGGRAPEMLVESLERFSSEREAFDIPGLRVARISNFVALVPTEDSSDLAALAEACVRQFDRFRAPPTDEELDRRRSGHLTPRQQTLLLEWGYPYVLEEWRFHMTLASQLHRGEADHVCDVLRDLAAPLLVTPLTIDAVCLFIQPAAGASFRLARRFPFGSGVRG